MEYCIHKYIKNGILSNYFFLKLQIQLINSFVFVLANDAQLKECIITMHIDQFLL